MDVKPLRYGEVTEGIEGARCKRAIDDEDDGC